VPIVADISDLAPAEFLLMLSMTSKTGKVSSVWKGSKTMLVLREGSIVYAASPTVRERLGSMLINRGLVTEEQLFEALERQDGDAEAGLLGSILVEMGAISQNDLRDVVKCQFETVVGELLSWDGGVMIFEGANIPDLGAVHVDPADVLMGMDVDTDRLVRDSLTRLNRGRATEEEGLPAQRSDEVAAESVPTDPPLEDDQKNVVKTDPEEENDRAAVRSLMYEMANRSVALTAEMTLAILGSAAEIADRAVLFLVQPRHLGVVGGFGLGKDGGQPSGKSLKVSRAHRSIFTDVIEGGKSHRGPVEEIEGNLELLEELGEPRPSEAIAVPLKINGEVVAVVYADGGPEGNAVGVTDSLESTLVEIATVMEAAHPPHAHPG
jgi:hypothetical protein